MDIVHQGCLSMIWKILPLFQVVGSSQNPCGVTGDGCDLMVEHNLHRRLDLMIDL